MAAVQLPPDVGRLVRIYFIAVCGCLWCAAPVAAQTWAKGAVPLIDCSDASPLRHQIIPSPDRSTTVEVGCRASSPNDEALAIRLGDGGGKSEAHTIDKKPFERWKPQELLWASDSKAFFVNGSESAYSGFEVVVYEVRGKAIVEHDATQFTQRDMVITFPPCKASNADDSNCRRIERDPEFNMSAIAWTNGSTNLVIFAEVPCSSSYGGIMCQVEGYEVETSTGRIVQKMNAREVKTRWQSKAAWNIRIPESPEFKK
jgi:hypothetical protein